MHKLLLDLPTSLQTSRLLLRAYQPGDGPVLYAAGRRNRQHLARFESGNSLRHLQSDEAGEIFAREMLLDWQARRAFLFGMFLRASGEWAGQIYVGVVNWDTPEFEAGYVVDQQHEGQGYVSEALREVLAWVFNHLGAQRVRLECSGLNERSQRVAEKCGFTREARFRQDHKEPDGSYSDTLVYGLLRKEWRAAKMRE